MSGQFEDGRNISATSLWHQWFDILICKIVAGGNCNRGKFIVDKFQIRIYNLTCFQEENPSRESTIVRTAGKLKPFSFNKILEDDDCNVHSASQRRQKKYNLKPSESLPPESFCSICHSPLKNSDTTSLNSIGNDEASVGIFAETCSSCQYQILPQEPSSLESFHSLLPQQMIYLAKNSSFYKHKSLRLESVCPCFFTLMPA